MSSSERIVGRIYASHFLLMTSSFMSWCLSLFFLGPSLKKFDGLEMSYSHVGVAIAILRVWFSTLFNCIMCDFAVWIHEAGLSWSCNRLNEKQFVCRTRLTFLVEYTEWWVLLEWTLMSLSHRLSRLIELYHLQKLLSWSRVFWGYGEWRCCKSGVLKLLLGRFFFYLY